MTKNVHMTVNRQNSQKIKKEEYLLTAIPLTLWSPESRQKTRRQDEEYLIENLILGPPSLQIFPQASFPSFTGKSTGFPRFSNFYVSLRNNAQVSRETFSQFGIRYRSDPSLTITKKNIRLPRYQITLFLQPSNWDSAVMFHSIYHPHRRTRPNCSSHVFFLIVVTYI